jgi:hypothetical protein
VTETGLTAVLAGINKAWVTFNAVSGTPTISDDYNVSSLTDNGTGNFTVVIDTDPASANYAIAIGLGALATGSRGCAANIVAKATTGFQMNVLYEQDEGTGNWGASDLSEISAILASN